MADIPFTKMVGTGNDFVVIDAVHQRLSHLERQWSKVAKAWCDRHRGIGADGILLLEPSKVANVRMRIFNADGSEAQMCGNGARCVARLVSAWPSRRNGAVRSKEGLTIETLSGTISAKVQGERIRVRMGLPRDLKPELRVQLDGSAIIGAFVNTGVPHYVVPVKGLTAVDVNRLGRALRNHADFAPSGTNVNFIEWADAPTPRLRVRTYERGVEAETLACGTGMTAAVIIYGLRSGLAAGGRAVELTVQPASGDLLTIGFRAQQEGSDIRITDVIMDGAARIVYEGRCAWPLASVRRPARLGRKT